jgi:hypothetical protein
MANADERGVAENGGVVGGIVATKTRTRLFELCAICILRLTPSVLLK